MFNQFGDLERCALRPGNVHSADGREGLLKPVVSRYRGRLSRINFRADAGFAKFGMFKRASASRPAPKHIYKPESCHNDILFS